MRKNDGTTDFYGATNACYIDASNFNSIYDTCYLGVNPSHSVHSKPIPIIGEDWQSTADAIAEYMDSVDADQYRDVLNDIVDLVSSVNGDTKINTIAKIVKAVPSLVI